VKEVTPAAILARVRSIQGSTSEQDFPGLAEEHGAFLEARSGRSDAIAERNRTRAEETRRIAAQEAPRLAEAVRLCQQTIPADWPVLERARTAQKRIGWRPEFYGLQRKPSLAEVLALIRASTRVNCSACNDAQHR
jgi:hypothetical protein